MLRSVGCRRVGWRHSFGSDWRRRSDWVHRARQTGDRTAGRQGQPRRSKLDPHRAYILGLVEATPDMTISEILDKLAAERDVYAARATLWTFLDRCGLTFKKRPRTRPSRTARTS
jgi:transposase